MREARVIFEAFVANARRPEDEVEALLARHPQHADELRSLWLRYAQTARVLAQLGTDVGAGPVPRSRYRVVGEVARGGMGRVLEVWDLELRRALAMKVLRDEPDDPGIEHFEWARRRSRLVNEAQILSQLQHRGIVPIHEVACDERGQPYFTMTLLRGRTLDAVFDDVRERRDGWTVRRALEALRSACDAVAYAHAKGVVHRDLKPSNVMVTDDGDVFVIDWGLAKARGRSEPSTPELRRNALKGTRTGSGARDGSSATSVRTDWRDASESGADSPFVTREGDVLGTPSYMSPEQAAGRVEEVDKSSDVYSMGAMLYHLLAGRPPYLSAEEVTSPRDVLRAVLGKDPEPVREVARGAPKELVAICTRAMARERGRRYAGVDELARDLQAHLDGRVVRAHRTGRWITFSKWLLRNRLLAIAGGAAIAAGAGWAVTLEEFLPSPGSDATKLWDEDPVEAEVVELRPPAPVPEGLTAWFAGDGSGSEVLDVTGTIHGHATGDPFGRGFVGPGYVFDSDDDRIVFPHDARFEPGADGFTVEFWMRGGRSQVDPLITVVETSHGFGDNTGWAFQGDLAKQCLGWLLMRRSKSPSLPDHGIAFSLAKVFDGHWHHVAGTWSRSDGRMRYYADGVETVGDVVADPKGNERNLDLGFCWGGGSPQRFFRGALDELCFYDRALRPAEILAIFAAGRAGKVRPGAPPGD